MSRIGALGALARVCTILGAVALAVMMLCTTYDVVARAAFSRPLYGVVDITEIMVLCVAFLGLPEVCLRDSQICVDVLDSLVPPRVLTGLRLIGAAMTIVFMAILLVNVVRPMLDAYQFGDIKADTGFPVYLLFIVIFFSLLSAALMTLAALVRIAGGEARPLP